MKIKLCTNCLVFLITIFSSFSQEKWIESKIKSNYSGNPAIVEIKYLGNGNCIATSGREVASLNLLKSSDNGLTWQVYHEDWDFVDKPPYPNPFEVTASSIVNENAIFIAFMDDAIVKRYYSDPKKQDTFKISKKDDFFKNINMKDENYGVLTNGNEVFITKNGWKSFETKSLGVPIYEVNIQSNGYINFLTEYNDSIFFVVSENQGFDWKFYNIDNDCLTRKKSFITDSIGWVLSQKKSGVGVTQSHLIHKTTDGGHTWKKQLDTFNFELYNVTDIKFKDQNYGIAFGQNNMIYETTDGGNHWLISHFNSRDNSEFRMRIEFTKDMILVGTYDNGIWRRPIYKTGVEEFEQVYKTYPNPFKNSFVIEDSKISDGSYNLKIFDIKSNEVYNNVIEYNGGIKIQIDLQKGCYFWNLAGSKSFYGKIMKED
ncbi:MAG: T9SS type A sorting domain-containing protein [Candidatus Kapabacteria bacterium]|nr:T9SS type A sorting domain-containing protein [Candidatus Kapabacteria bacterium]